MSAPPCSGWLLSQPWQSFLRATAIERALIISYPSRLLGSAAGTEHPRKPTVKLYVHQPGGAKKRCRRPKRARGLAELVALWPHVAAPGSSPMTPIARACAAEGVGRRPPARNDPSTSGRACARPHHHHRLKLLSRRSWLVTIAPCHAIEPLRLPRGQHFTRQS